MLEKDMQNHMRWKIIGGVIRLKRDVTPYKFDCRRPGSNRNRRPTSRKHRRKHHSHHTHRHRHSRLPRKHIPVSHRNYSTSDDSDDDESQPSTPRAATKTMKPKQTIRMYCDKNLQNMSNMFQTFYQDEQLTDVRLYCKEGSVRVHRLILAANSLYFRKILTENPIDKPIIFMYGLTLKDLDNLVELMYKGVTDVPTEKIDAMYGLFEELQITGIHENNTKQMQKETDAPYSFNSSKVDTRFRGLKRVAVDYREEQVAPSNFDKKSSQESSTSSESTFELGRSSEQTSALDCTITSSSAIVSRPVSKSGSDASVMSQAKRNPSSSKTSDSWSKKPRKFKCDLCSASFKRASHLTRHQLVHTGERPFPCNMCDKAFSRHDKLKHHVKKAHEEMDGFDPGAMCEWRGHEQVDDVDNPDSGAEDQADVADVERIESPLLLVQTEEVYTEDEKMDEEVLPPPVKKPRGRPRKYPKVDPPQEKRPRGRPRIHPVNTTASLPQPKSSSSAVQSSSIQKTPQVTENQNYDVTNLPFGDLEYLTRPIRECIEEKKYKDITKETELNNEVLIEPLVEIKTEPNCDANDRDDAASSLLSKSKGITVQAVARSEEPEPKLQIYSKDKSVEIRDSKRLTIVGNEIAKIGECTISVTTSVPC